jgi:hypothetical protein
MISFIPGSGPSIQSCAMAGVMVLPSPPMTYDELDAILTRHVMRRFHDELKKRGMVLREAFEHGITAEWASHFGEITEGDVRLSDWKRVIHPPNLLHKRLRTSTVSEPSMEKSHRLAISEGHKGSDDAFMKAIRAKGYSQNTLAKRVGLNQAVLSLHRRSLRRIKRSKAEAIEKLTGWPADGRHWPGGIVTDGE